MNITLYANTSENNSIAKSLTVLATITGGTLRAACSVQNPTIRITGNFSSSCNYFYVEEFGRYYFLTDATLVDGTADGAGVWDISGHVDVLKTYASGILGSKGICVRNQSDINYRLFDTMAVSYQNPHVVTKLFPSAPTGSSRIIVTI